MEKKGIVYLKKATKTAETGEEGIRLVVGKILERIRLGNEEAARKYALEFDGWDGEIVVSRHNE